MVLRFYPSDAIIIFFNVLPRYDFLFLVLFSLCCTIQVDDSPIWNKSREVTCARFRDKLCDIAVIDCISS